MFFSEKLIFPWGGRSNYRIPSMIVTNDGTFLAFCNDRKDTSADHASEVSLVLCKKKAGEDWGEVETLYGVEGWACTIGNAVYDCETDKAIVFFGRNPVSTDEFVKYTKEQLAEFERQREEKAKAMGIRRGSFRFESTDGGNTWTERDMVINPVEQEHWDGTTQKVTGSGHGSAHGIQLRYGEHKGRLLCPSRMSVGSYNDWPGLRKCVYNNAIYSDDHGETWQATKGVQVGTGEGTLLENSDGTITYNSRAYFQDQKRYLATSTDGGETWGDFRTDDFLIEEKNIGCNASFIRVDLEEIKDKSMLPADAKGVTVFANPRSHTRANMCACVSFDEGKTYSHVKVIDPGFAAYSSLVWNPVTQTFCLLYEHGDKHPYNLGLSAVEFDLEWLLSE